MVWRGQGTRWRCSLWATTFSFWPSASLYAQCCCLCRVNKLCITHTETGCACRFQTFGYVAVYFAFLFFRYRYA